VRCRTAAILSIVLIGGMFGLPLLVKAFFLPSLEPGNPNPLPVYETVLLEVAFFCMRFKWLLALPIVVALYVFAAVTSESRVYR
jgi:hypothetical protein